MTKELATIQTSVESGVLTITLNRPDSLNAFNEQMAVELAGALRVAERDDGVRCVLLTGAGRAFCSGQDLAEIRSRYAADASAEQLDFARHLREKYNPIVQRIRTIEKPVVAAVNGVAAGAGASFTFACDLRIAARSASFVMAFVHVGLIPDSGATLTLLQHVGYSKAAELCMLGEKISAEEAHRHGLVNKLVDDAELPAAARELAARLASMPTRAIGLTKRALNRAWTATIEDTLEAEAYGQATAGRTADHREGVLAFLEKRKPGFMGR
ncbi:MAG: enoyl-CoA hydratase/isomerase family protein [Phycisphaerales bacterium]|nr:enoyl-CoA hydratase/isomerase family protein [Phycisphaerales bacterium]